MSLRLGVLEELLSIFSATEELIDCELEKSLELDSKISAPEEEDSMEISELD
jgi:hypothetical protein